MISVTPLRYSETFKRAFSDVEIFNRFTSDILGFEVNVDEVLTEYEYPEIPGFVKIKFDLYAVDPNGRFVIEMQHIRHPDFYDRFLYYHIASMMQQVKRHTSYKFPETVYTIVILTNPTHGDTHFSFAVSDMSPINEFNEKVEVYPHRLVFVIPSRINEKTPEAIRNWLALIEDSLDHEVDETKFIDPLHQRILEKIKSDDLSQEELAEVKDEIAWEQAIEIAHHEGIEQGEQETQKRIARSLLEKGIDLETISETTGLSINEIEKLDQQKEN